MNKEEIKEKLKENGAWCTECYTREEDRYVKIIKAMQLIEQLDEPQKPVVPKFVAEWIELCKEKAELISCLSGSYKYGVDQYKRITEDEDWLFKADHQELVARAWLDGYEVEKEPLYYVKLKIPGATYYLIQTFLMPGDTHMCFSAATERYGAKWKNTFTEAEIKEIDERYWPFAVPVEKEETE